MKKPPKFAQQILAANKVKADRVQEKLKGESTLYMGDPALHWGIGGWVRGRANLVWGIYGSGKSSIALKGAAEEQRKTRGAVVIFDSEYNYKDPHETDLHGTPTQDALAARERFRKAGLDWEMVFIVRSNVINDLFGPLTNIKEDLKNDPNCVSAIIVDSWGGVQSESAIKKIGDGDFASAGNSFGGNAKTMGPILQDLLNIAAEHAVTMFFVQHCMKNMDMYGPEYIMIGGERLKFLVHNMFFLRSVAAKDSELLDGSIKVGKKIRFKCDKSRNVVEGRTGEFWMNFEDLEFAKPEFSLFNLATQLGVIAHPKTLVVDDEGNAKKTKEGLDEYKENKLYWEYPVGVPTPQKFKGQQAVMDALKDDKDLFNSVFSDCMKSKKIEATKQEEVLNDKESQKSAGKLKKAK
jgi:RecA/RadA recombinase